MDLHDVKTEMAKDAENAEVREKERERERKRERERVCVREKRNKKNER